MLVALRLYHADRSTIRDCIEQNGGDGRKEADDRKGDPLRGYGENDSMDRK